MRFLLLAAAALIALTPGVASAHRGHDHGVAEQPAAQPAAAPQEQSRSWLTPCPGGAGGKCCCEKLVACSPGAKPPVIASHGWRIVPVPAAEAARPQIGRAEARSLLALSPSRPRGPPLS